MIECHVNPDAALTDGKQQIIPEALKTLLSQLVFRSKGTGSVEHDLAELRGEIDDIDGELLQLLSRRMEVSGRIGEYKKCHNVAVVQMDRWKQILADHIAVGGSLNLDQELVEAVFEAIHQASIRRQTDILDDGGNQ